MGGVNNYFFLQTEKQNVCYKKKKTRLNQTMNTHKKEDNENEQSLPKNK